MLSGPVNEFSLLFHCWQEFLITATLALFSSNRLVKCHAKCKLINKHKLWILCSLYYAASLCLMWYPIQIAGYSWFLVWHSKRGRLDWHSLIFTEKRGCRRTSDKVVMELHSQTFKSLRQIPDIHILFTLGWDNFLILIKFTIIDSTLDFIVCKVKSGYVE